MDGPTVGRFQVPAQRADHADGERLVQTERIAQCQDLLPHCEIAGASQGEGRELLPGRIDLEHRQVLARCQTDDPCTPLRLVR